MEISYTYEPASTELHPTKKGVNRMAWKNGVMIYKEYFEVDPRNAPSPAMQAWMNATPEEKQQMANDLKQFL